jgi:TolB protein
VSRGALAIAPAWSPDGGSIAYSENRGDGVWMLFIQRLATGVSVRVPSTSVGNDYGATFSPDGKTLAFSHDPGTGADIESTDISKMCCAHLLTQHGRLADNVSPAYSPDGRRIAFVSQRTGTTEIWVMDDDGTDARQLVPSSFDGGTHPLMTYSPAWSPDGSKLMFARDTRVGGRQLYTMAVGGGSVIQQTSAGRNEDASWAPDSRHVVFKSSRGGGEQLWILDVESTALRQLTSHGGAQYPAWSGVVDKNP